jgi:hypothetical protein
MKKLKLEIDALRVESFASLPDRRAKLGTVHGRARPTDWCGTENDCPAWTLTFDPYNPCNTDEGSCADAC